MVFMKLLIKSFFILFLSCVTLFPQSAGKSGLSFLKIGSGARNIALADNGSIYADDVSAVFYNPAKLSKTTNPEIMLMHNEWIQDVRSEVIAVKFSLFGIPLGFGFNSTKVGDIEIRQKPGEAEGTFNAQYFFGSLSSAFYIIPELSFGATFKFINEDIFQDYSAGYGLDFGLSYSTPLENIDAALVIKNLGSMNLLRNESTKLPSEIRAGLVYSLNLDKSGIKIIPGFEFQKYLATEDIHINIGSEFLYDNLFALRLGYQTFYEAKNFTGGIGLIWGNLSFDYALSPFAYGLGQGHTVSLNFKF